MLGREWVRLCETTAGASLSTAKPHQHLTWSSEKSHNFYSLHTFRQEQNNSMLHTTGNKWVYFMQSDFDICFILSGANFL